MTGGIRDRAGLKTEVGAKITDGSASTSPQDVRDVGETLSDSAVLFGEHVVRVIDMSTTTPPGSPADRDAHVVAATATGAWTGWENDIAVWDGQATTPAWVRVPRFDGMLVINLDDDIIWLWDGSAWVKNTPLESLIVAVGDETTDLTTGTGKVTFRMPYAFTVTEVRAMVVTAPTGANLVVDINEGGTSILSTKLSIDAGEKTSKTAATPPVISDADLADDAEITVDIDQIGSTVAGAGLKVTLIGRQA